MSEDKEVKPAKEEITSDNIRVEKKVGNDAVRYASLDNTENDILEWAKEGKVIKFDPNSFIMISETTYRELDRHSKMNYNLAKEDSEILKRERQKREEGMPRIEVQQLRPLSGSFADKERAIKNDIYNSDPSRHVAFKRKDEISGAKSAGYKLESEMIDKYDIKIDNEYDLAPMTISKDRYKEHLMAVCEGSRSGSRRAKEAVAEAAVVAGTKIRDLSTKSTERMSE